MTSWNTHAHLDIHCFSRHKFALSLSHTHRKPKVDKKDQHIVFLSHSHMHKNMLIHTQRSSRFCWLDSLVTAARWWREAAGEHPSRAQDNCIISLMIFLHITKRKNHSLTHTHTHTHTHAHTHCVSRLTQVVFDEEFSFLQRQYFSPKHFVLDNLDNACLPYCQTGPRKSFLNISLNHAFIHMFLTQQLAKTKISDTKRSGHSKLSCSSSFYHVTEEIECQNKLNNTKYRF